MKKIKELLVAYKEPIAYIVFGVLTTVVNVAVYYLMSEILAFHYLISNVIAWVASVLFAFITNKLWVFNSKTQDIRGFMVEMISFFLARFSTGIMDMILMWALVDVVAMEEMLAKIGVNVLVIILNYVMSKLWVFRDKK